MEPLDRRMMLAGAGLLGAAALARTARGGPLDPPAGPVSPTYKTLDQVEPRIPVQSLPGSGTALHVISEPGSYYLAGNIHGVEGKRAIAIASSGVSLDLRTSVLTGASGVLAGIETEPGVGGVQVRGGMFVGWPNSVWLGDWSTIREVTTVDLPSGFGLRVGAHGIIDGCLAAGWGNGLRIVAGGDAAIIQNCEANGGDNCFRLQFGAHLRDCVAAYGVLGVDCPNAAQHVRALRVLRCLTGVNVDSEAIVEDCEFFECSNSGVNCIGSRVTIRRNVAIMTPIGVRVSGSGNHIAGNHVSGASSAYDIGPGNSYGPIVNVAGIGDISSVTGASHPWANFVF